MTVKIPCAKNLWNTVRAMHIWKIDRALRKHLEVRLPMWKKSNLKNKKALQLMLQKYKRSLEIIRNIYRPTNLTA
jgi:hypothetical protein